MKALRTILLLAVLVLGVQFTIFAQKPPLPGTPEETNYIPDEGSVPIGSGLAVLLSLAGAYGGYKLYKNANQDEEEN